MKTNKNILLPSLVIALAFLYGFKKAKPKYISTVYVDQLGMPTGSYQVYSKIGTNIFDKNNNPIYTFDTANIGMTVTDFINGVYSIVLGDSFEYGTSGYVNQSDVTHLN